VASDELHIKSFAMGPEFRALLGDWRVEEVRARLKPQALRGERELAGWLAIRKRD
jgi:hypothetical protein